MKSNKSVLAMLLLCAGLGAAGADEPAKCGDKSREKPCDDCPGMVAFEVIGRNYALLDTSLPSGSTEYAKTARSVGREIARLKAANAADGPVQQVCIVSRTGSDAKPAFVTKQRQRAQAMAQALNAAGVTQSRRSKAPPQAVVVMVE